MASGVRLDVLNLRVVVPSPGVHRRAAAGEVLRREEVVNDRGMNQRWRGREIKIQGERGDHLEADGRVPEVEEDAGRPELSIYLPELETESAILMSIGELPARFLGCGGRGEQGGSGGGLGSMRGGL
jgi:hypothetical protein